MSQILKEGKNNIFDNGFGDSDYWMIADVIKGIYTSDGTIATLMDFERVLDDLDIYSYRNWFYGELVDGPELSRYSVTCTFMWPYKLMPDPRAVRRLLSLDCKVAYKQTKIKIPKKIENPGDYAAGTHLAALTEKDIWLVRITMPKDLMRDIKQGSLELEDQTIDLADLDDAYDDDLDKEQNQTNPQSAGTPAPGGLPAPGSLGAPPLGGGLGAPSFPGGL